MPKVTFFISLLTGIAAAQQKSNPFNLVSAATLFTGPESPVVDTGYGLFKGKSDQPTGTENYLGLKYAHAPRFNHSFLADQSLGSKVQDVSDYGPACPQHEFTSLLAPNDIDLGAIAGYLETGLLAPVLKQSEDCLSINIQRPQGIKKSEKLPVLVWIHGGAFESGESSSFLSETSAIQGVFYQGANIVKRSVEMGKPIVFASINYRLNNFGFSASKELEDAGLLNLGFEDQRNGLKWINKYISKFNGDPKKVTIMGESAGSWSVSGHLVANNGDNEGLFRGAIPISGGPVKVDGPERQQATFDDMVNFVDCGSAADKLDCLQKVPVENLGAATGRTNYFIGYRSLASAWTLRPDGKYFEKSPDLLAKEGKIADVPIMTGNMKDEGTLFALITCLNTTTDDEFEDYFRTYWWPHITGDQMQKLMDLYPNDPMEGSPFDTGLANSLFMFKRLSALIGDYSFQAQRRQLLAHAPNKKKYNYLTEQRLPLPLIEGTPVGQILDSTKLTELPILGSFHASDIVLNWFGTLPPTLSKNSDNLLSILVSFVHDQDPNGHGKKDLPHWPTYNQNEKQTIHFVEGSVNIITDNYRERQMEYINEISDALRI